MANAFEVLRRDPSAPEEPAMLYASTGDQGALIALIQTGVATAITLNQPDDRGYTVLHEMAWRERSVKAMLTAALATGMNLNVPDRLGQTALHHAAYVDNVLVTKALIAAGADLNVRTLRGDTPFQVAFRNGREKVARLLIQAGADLTSHNLDGEQALDHEPPLGGAWRQELRAEIRQAMVQQEQNELRAAMGDTLPSVNVASRSRL